MLIFLRLSEGICHHSEVDGIWVKMNVQRYSQGIVMPIWIHILSNDYTTAHSHWGFLKAVERSAQGASKGLPFSSWLNCEKFIPAPLSLKILMVIRGFPKNGVLQQNDWEESRGNHRKSRQTVSVLFSVHLHLEVSWHLNVSNHRWRFLGQDMLSTGLSGKSCAMGELITNSRGPPSSLGYLSVYWPVISTP